MSDKTFPGITSRNRDLNAKNNAIYVNLTDDAGQSITLTGTALDVNIASGSISIDFSYVDDSAFTLGTDNVGAIGLVADETAPDSVDEGDIGIPRMTLDRKQLMTIANRTTDDAWVIDASGLGQIDLADHALTNTNPIPISKDSNANSETNPLFTQSVDTAVSGSEIHDYDTAVDVASDATDNHDYTVAGTTFLLKSVLFATSGDGKYEIQIDNGGGFNTIAVGFTTGKQGDSKQINFDPAVEATTTVRVIRTNREGQAQDVYSTIIGHDV